MALEREEDFGFDAYLDIQAELDQWDDSTPASSSRYPPGLQRNYDHGPSNFEGCGEEGDASPPLSIRPLDGIGTVIQVTGPPHGHSGLVDDQSVDVTDVTNEGDQVEAVEQMMDDGLDFYRPYHDALLTYLQSRERSSEVTWGESCNSIQKIEDDDYDSARRSDMKFLESLSSICLNRRQNNVSDTSEEEIIWSEASNNEGNFWDLMSALRSEGLSCLFYCMDVQQPLDLLLSNDPAALVDSAPADVLDACLAGEKRNVAIPLRRLIAALGWIEACHARKFDEALNKECEGNNDPILPPPRRRTMWPGLLAELQKQHKGMPSPGPFHPDVRFQTILGSGNCSVVNSDGSSFIAPEDETDDARLLRACFMLFQAGRMEDALKLVNDCGQPWRAVMWTGGDPLSSDGTGNPTRGLWKTQCRKIANQMAKLVDSELLSISNDDGGRVLFPSVAYEAAIMTLLSESADTGINNPVFQTWEDGVHVVLRSELGIIKDDVLRSHNNARVEDVKSNSGLFQFPGTEFECVGDENALRGNCGDLGAALGGLESFSSVRIRKEGSDPFRNGMASLLIGHNALKEYIEECGALSLETEDDDEACFLRFVTHLVVYVDSVLPDFSSQLALPPGVDTATDGVILSLRKLLILKYVAHLSSRRALWPLVALYTSLLTSDSIVDTYSSFLIHVHSDRERRMALEQARTLFPEGLDCQILRNVVRALIMCEKGDWKHEPGEEPAPACVVPADFRMMRSIYWLCYYTEHMPDALIAANMLLRRLLLSPECNQIDSSDLDLHAPKLFMGNILPKDLVDVAVDQRAGEGGTAARLISLPLLLNMKAEFLSVEDFLKAHTYYVNFLDAIAKTSPCHKSSKVVDGSQSKQESEIAYVMERNTFRQKKMDLCKVIIDSSTRASEALMDVLTFAGGWLVDANTDLCDEETHTVESKARYEEMEAIRSNFVPRAVFMLHEVLDKTAMWLEQIVYDTLDQFGSASKDMLLTLFCSFDETYRFNDDLTIDILTTSPAAPGYWQKKALQLSSIVANDAHGLHKEFHDYSMEKFLLLMAEAHTKLQHSLNVGQTFFD